MSSSDSSKSTPLSKKLINPRANPQTPDRLASKTPEKQPTELPRRARNRGFALSLKEVREIAQARPRHRTDQIKSARKQILSWPTQTPVNKSNVASDGAVKLPEKYEILGEFFDCLDSTIRLLRLKGSMSTFTNICPKIECLTDRRFSIGHLAKLKFILPEAIEIKKVRMFDEQTSCMKPDLHVTINIDAIEYDGKLSSETKNMHLRKAFRSRLEEFLKTHPEGDEIPEETLPEPFNRSKQNLHSNIIKGSTSSSPIETLADTVIDQQPAVSAAQFQGDVIPEETQPETFNHSKQDLHSNCITVTSLSLAVEISTEALKKQQPAVASHLSQSFRRRFSKNVTKNEAEKTNHVSSEVSLQPSVHQVPKPSRKEIHSTGETSTYVAPFPTDLPSNSTSSGNCMEFFGSPACLPPTCPPATPSKEIDPLNSKDGSPIEIARIQSTPAKLASTPARFMAITPALHQPKRCHMTPDDDSMSSPNKLVRRPPRSRSLKFDTPVKSEKVVDEVTELGGISVDDDILDILPDNLLQSIREKERKAMEERDPAISQAKRRQQMIAFLPKLFNMIHFLFQSIKRSVITKEELMHKIIASHCDIVDRREVEEQLNLLLELVPEWISEKFASAGDLLVCINKTSSPEVIRAQLEEAK